MDEKLIKRRATQRWRPQSGVEHSQGSAYPTDLAVQQKLQKPLSIGIDIRGWINPYKTTIYPFNVPNQSTDSPIMAINANYKRTYLLIQNKGPGNLFVNFGQEPSLNGDNCIALVTTQFYEQIGGGGVFPDGNSPMISAHLSRDSIFILSDAANTRCIITEGVWTNTGPGGERLY